MSRNIGKILFIIILFYCAACSDIITKDVRGTSIFDTGSNLMVIAESFSEYEWNQDAEDANDIFLTGLNEYFYKKLYDESILYFYDALDIYTYDARIYVRLAESLARANDVQRAHDILLTGSRNLTGFLQYPGINAYLTELRRAISQPQLLNEPDQGILQKTAGIITWIPRKLWGLLPF
ncbi:hypothetical protein ACFL6I_08205 [candidate division KSB1 bacterium]